MGDIFRGEWKDDFASGLGILHYANGDVYNGQWLNDRRHGHGLFTSAEDGKRYEGQWLNGMRHGEGMLMMKDGDVLEGKWEQGCLTETKNYTLNPKSPWNDPKY